jgi:hypothetical protein
VADRPAGSRRIAVLTAAGVGVAHLALTAAALAAVLRGTGAPSGPPLSGTLAFAVLAFPLFYTPWRPTLWGLAPAGLLVAVLNALIWAAAAGALAATLSRRRAV